MIFVDNISLLWWLLMCLAAKTRLKYVWVCIFKWNPASSYLRKSWREIFRLPTSLSVTCFLFTAETNPSQSYLSPAGYSLGVSSGVVDGCHCSTPFHILKRQLSKANKQSFCHSALKLHCVMRSLPRHVCIRFHVLLTNTAVKWIKSVQRI